MHGSDRAIDHGLQDVRLVCHAGVERGATFMRTAVAEQARRHTAEAALPLFDHPSPRRAGAARARHEHHRRTIAARLVVDAAVPVVDHDTSSPPASTVAIATRFT